MIHPRFRGRSREFMILAMPWIAMAVFLLVWELVCVVFDLPEILLPRPTRVFEVFFQRIDILLAFCWDTLWTTLVGFFLAIAGGVMLGVLIGASPLIYSGLYPLLIAFNAVPKVALVPILMIWVGVGATPAVVTAFVISFFPIVVNVATGLATIEPEMRDVLRVHQIGRELDDVGKARALRLQRRADVGEGLGALRIEVGRGLAVLSGADLSGDEQELGRLHAGDLRILPQRFAEAVGIQVLDLRHGRLRGG